MKKYNKEFKYKSYIFNISVELNTKVERRPDGYRFHTVIINDMGVTNYYVKKEVLDIALKSHIEEQIELAIKFVDNREDVNSSLEIEMLLSMGFS